MDARLKIEGWAKAVQEERRERDEAWCEPFDEIAGLIVRHASLLDIVRLERAGNPFATPYAPTRDDTKGTVHAFAIQFAAYLSAGYIEGGKIKRRLILRRIQKIDAGKLIRGAAEYSQRTFSDSIGSGGGGKRLAESHWSAIADYVHLISGEYGYSREEVVTAPYRIVLQQVRQILRKHDPKFPLVSKSDHIVGEYLENKNRKCRSVS